MREKGYRYMEKMSGWYAWETLCMSTQDRNKWKGCKFVMVSLSLGFKNIPSPLYLHYSPVYSDNIIFQVVFFACHLELKKYIYIYT